MQNYKAKLAEKRPLDDAEKIWRYDLELVEPHRIKFEAGQYVDVEITEEQVANLLRQVEDEKEHWKEFSEGEVQKRKFWMCSQPEEDHGVDFLVDVESKTLGSRFFSRLKPGDEVMFEGPKGKGVGGGGDEKLYFVADGVGIAPVRSVLSDLLETKRDKREMKLLWGLGYVEEMFWVEDFYQLSRDFDNFQQQITLSHPPMPEWHLSSGSAEEVLSEEKLEWNGYTFVISGFGKMVERVEKLLESKGVGQEKIKILKFGK